MRFSWPACLLLRTDLVVLPLLLRTDLVVLPLGRRDLCGAVDRQATRTSPIFESPIQILVRILHAAHFGKVLQSGACIQRTALNQDIFTNQHEKIIESRCVCVFFPFILDIKFVGRTSRGHTGGRPHRIYHPPSFCSACLCFSREKDSAIPFPRQP